MSPTIHVLADGILSAREPAPEWCLDLRQKYPGCSFDYLGNHRDTGTDHVLGVELGAIIGVGLQVEDEVRLPCNRHPPSPADRHRWNVVRAGPLSDLLQGDAVGILWHAFPNLGYRGNRPLRDDSSRHADVTVRRDYLATPFHVDEIDVKGCRHVVDDLTERSIDHLGERRFWRPVLQLQAEAHRVEKQCGS